VSRPWRWVVGVAGLIGVVTACQEKLTSPADCPALCPGGSAEVFDTVAPNLAGQDSSFPRFDDRINGYIGRGDGIALLVSNGLPASEDRAVYRFASRSESLNVRDTLRSYTVDSALLAVSLVARDTLVDGLKVFLYRINPAVDSTATFESIESQFADSLLIDSISVPDSVNAGALTTTLRGADVAKLRLAPGGDSVLAIALRISANAPTGIRVGSLNGTNAASFVSYVTLDVPDTTTTIRKQALSRGAAFNTFVTQNPVVPDDNLLTVGGEPSSRAIVRFGLTDAFLDSITIVRATLELTPAQPILGLPTDSALIRATAVAADLGAKSPLAANTNLLAQDTLSAVQSDTFRLDVTSIVRFWQSTRTAPQSIFLRMFPEGATFSRAQFLTTRSPTTGGVVAPRLRITFQRSFSFENP
jgi:hypothetical protein